MLLTVRWLCIINTDNMLLAWPTCAYCIIMSDDTSLHARTIIVGREMQWLHFYLELWEMPFSTSLSISTLEWMMSMAISFLIQLWSLQVMSIEMPRDAKSLASSRSKETSSSGLKRQWKVQPLENDEKPESCGQKHSSIIIYDCRVILTRK